MLFIALSCFKVKTRCFDPNLNQTKKAIVITKETMESAFSLWLHFKSCQRRNHQEQKALCSQSLSPRTNKLWNPLASRCSLNIKSSWQAKKNLICLTKRDKWLSNEKSGIERLNLFSLALDLLLAMAIFGGFLLNVLRMAVVSVWILLPCVIRRD